MRIDEAPTAEYLLELVLVALGEATGLERSELCSKLVGVGSDGASVNTGSQNGLIALLRRRLVPKLQGSHCAAHRTRLSSACLYANALIGKLETLVQQVSGFYSAKWFTVAKRSLLSLLSFSAC